MNETTCLPAKGNEGTIQATASHMTDDEAVWSRWTTLSARLVRRAVQGCERIRALIHGEFTFQLFRADISEFHAGVSAIHRYIRRQPPTIGDLLPPLLRRHPKGFELCHQMWAWPRSHVQAFLP